MGLKAAIRRFVGRQTALPLQTGALPWRLTDARKPEVLLVTGRRSGRWMIPKGWPMIGKSLAAAAEREAFEEAGINGTVDPQPLGSIRYVKRNVFGDMEIEILVHPMAVKNELPDWPERGERTRRWFPIKKAGEQVESPELRDLIAILGKRLKQLSI
jgi:8-oxo-dGTP pyrophosphatase MutT (NUDIX family)